MRYAIPARTQEQQKLASDPRLSAWVSAHAGSGKTHVLAQRVVRLLLDGVDPSRLICLTFTKAAAANMSQRVFGVLAGWTLMDDHALRASIRATGADPPSDLDIARRLFADAVDTPGGLKIQTIHAFCERVLHLFPFEANAPADFRVVDELERSELLQLARRRALEAADYDPLLRAALARVAQETWDGGFERTVDATLARRDLVREREATIARLPEALGLASDEDEASIARAMIDDGIAWTEWTSIADILAEGTKTDRERASQLRRAASLAPDPACLDDYLALFFTQKEELRASVATKTIEKLSPGLPARLLAEGARLSALRDKMRAAEACARSAALLRLAAACLDQYEALKRARGLLDFDDLIARTRALLARDGAADWALYKLDGGVDHILVDEAQDTSEAQWDILQALAREFTVGAGASPRLRTFFAVGDEKQSIFSFQGAAPAAFGRMSRTFEKRARDAEQQFAPVALDLSFRSAPKILEAVDLVFAREEALRGLTVQPDAPPHHYALKQDVAGLVEIWSPIAGEKASDPESWVLPVDLPHESDPPVELARAIARKIAGFVATGSRERVVDSASGALRPIRPGDVMILVRRRDAFFEAMVRALKDARVPVAGADRLDVGQHIAVMDLLAAARAALAPDDDLSLACALKSPLCGLTDDDLIAIAPRRPGSLSEALAASTDPHLRTAAAQVEGWRRAAAAKPFDFFSRLLGPDQGRRAFVARLGPEAGDAIDEFMALALEHERREAPSLLAFVHELETISLTVKRDLESSGDLVRVMTAHAAKGLEAKIVFLPDTCSTPTGSHDPSLFEIATRLGPALVWSERKADDPPAVATRRAAVRAEADDEYRRLLYVAMTRAEERLYIAGHHGKTGPKEGCWRNLVVAALRDHCIAAEDPHAPGGEVLRFGAPNLGDEAARKVDAAPVALPDWIARDAPIEIEPAPPIRPANALAGADAFDPTERQPTDATEAINRGLLVHRLLQSLPELAPSARSAAARRFLRAQAPDLADGAAEALVDEVLRVLDAPECAPLFGASARAEVAVAARIARRDRAPLDIAGRIDRLAETKDEIWIADFKTGAEPESVPAAYVAQLALYRAAVAQIYPDRGVRAFVLWTATTRLCEIDASAMERALASI